MKQKEIKRKQSNGFIVFEKYSKRYFFEDISKKEIKEIYKNGFDLPLRVQWRLTKMCNLNCKHCYLNEKNQKSAELSKEEIVDIAKKIVKNKIFEVLITGGEPTIKEGIKEVLEILGKHCSLTIFTNALQREPLLKILPVLKKYKDTIRINVSLDGPEEIHDSIRGKGSFNKTLENINFLAREGLEVVINTVLTKKFKPYLEQFIEDVRNTGVEAIQFSKFYPLGEGKKYPELMLSPEEFKNILKKLMKISKEIKDPKIIFDHTFCFLLGENKSEVDTRKCSGGLSKIIIESNGDIFPCQLLPHKEFKMGNILKATIKEAWDSKNRLKFLEDFFPEECKSCNMNKYCTSGCKAASYSIHKTLKNKDPYCFYGK